MPFRVSDPFDLIQLPAFVTSRMQAELRDLMGFGDNRTVFFRATNQFLAELGRLEPGGFRPTRQQVGTLVSFEMASMRAGARLQQALENDKDYIIDVPASARAAEGIYVNATVTASLGPNLPYNEYFLSLRLPPGSPLTAVSEAILEALDELQQIYEVVATTQLDIQSTVVTRASAG